MQPAAARRHALPALLVAASAAAIAGCDKPRPFAAFELARSYACGCKDLECARQTESILDQLLAKDPAPNTSIQTARAPIIDETRRCLTAVWRAHQPPELFTAEAEQLIRQPGPCETFFSTARQLLSCDRAPLSARTRTANDVLSLRTNWDANGTMRLPELHLYDMCLAALSNTLGVERCD